jgi:Zn-finger nucleic acid-binding protein
MDESRTHPTSIECPKCHASMMRVKVGDIEIDRCRACGGLWLDALEKEHLLATPGAAEEADSGPTTMHERMDAVRRIKCPRDHSDMIPMVDLEQPHVKFESCTVCGGMFLDAGELKDLAEHTLAERIREYFGSG